VMSDLAAPTAKCAASEMTAAATTAGIPLMKKNGMMGMAAPTAVESAPEVAETQGLASASSLVPGARGPGATATARGRWRCG
jgi:hypothetical protein